MEVAIGQPAVIEGERPCIRCGYALAGLPTSGLCPECGTPAKRSLMGDLLIYSDPQYVATLRRGATAVLVSVVLVIALNIALFVLHARLPGAVFLVQYFSIGVLSVFVLGWVWFTTPDAGQLSTNKGEKPRRIVRACLTALIALKVGTVTLPLLVPVHRHVMSALTRVDNVLLAVGLVAGMHYLMWLAVRLPNQDIFRNAGRLRSYLWIVAVCTSVTVLALLLEGPAKSWGLSPNAAKLVDTGVKLGKGLVRFAGSVVTLLAFIRFCSLFTKLRGNLATVADAQLEAA